MFEGWDGKRSTPEEAKKAMMLVAIVLLTFAVSRKPSDTLFNIAVIVVAAVAATILSWLVARRKSKDIANNAAAARPLSHKVIAVDAYGGPMFRFAGHEDLTEEHYEFGTVHDPQEVCVLPAGYMLKLKIPTGGYRLVANGPVTYGELASGNLVKNGD